MAPIPTLDEWRASYALDEQLHDVESLVQQAEQAARAVRSREDGQAYRDFSDFAARASCAVDAMQVADDARDRRRELLAYLDALECSVEQRWRQEAPVKTQEVRRPRRVSRERSSVPGCGALCSSDARRRQGYRRVSEGATPSDALPMLKVSCASCGLLLSKRGMQVYLAADPSKTLLSTDRRPENIVEQGGASAIPGLCSCEVQDFACSCGLRLGYCLASSCEACKMMQEDGDHSWFMSSDCVVVEPRMTQRGDAMLWPPPRDGMTGIALDGPPPPASFAPAEAHGFSCSPGFLPDARPPAATLPPVAEQAADAENCVPFSSPLSERNATGLAELKDVTDRAFKPLVPALPTHLEDIKRRESELSTREAEIFEKDLEQVARDKFLCSVTAAHQEAEAQLRNREQEVAVREMSLDDRERRLSERRAEDLRTAELERERAWAAIREVQAQSMEVMSQLAETKGGETGPRPSVARTSIGTSPVVDMALDTDLDDWRPQPRRSSCAPAAATGAADSGADSGAIAWELDSLRRELEAMRTMIAAKDLEAQSARVKAAADVLHMQEELNEARSIADAAREEAAAERRRADEAAARAARAMLPRPPAPPQQDGGGRLPATARRLEELAHKTAEVSGDLWRRTADGLRQGWQHMQEAAAPKPSAGDDGRQAASAAPPPVAGPIAGSVSEAHLQNACKLAEKRESLQRWEEELASRARALQDAEWRAQAERPTMEGGRAEAPRKDGSGVPPRPQPGPQFGPLPAFYPGMPSAWGYQQTNFPLQPPQGVSGWIRQWMGCAHRRVEW